MTPTEKIIIALSPSTLNKDDFSKEKISKSTLVSLMTFSKPRLNNQYDYEVLKRTI